MTLNENYIEIMKEFQYTENKAGIAIWKQNSSWRVFELQREKFMFVAIIYYDGRVRLMFMKRNKIKPKVKADTGKLKNISVDELRTLLYVFHRRDI